MHLTNSTLILIIAGLLITLFSSTSCSKDLEEIVTNVDPICQVTYPTSGLQVIHGETITITAAASDSDGSIIDVDFFIDDVYMASDESAPYTYDWNTNTALPGNHTIKAVSDDGIGVSNPSEITVTIIQN